MTDKPKTRLNLKPKASTPATPENAKPMLTRSRKCVIRRDEPPAEKLTKIKAPPPKVKKKPKPSAPKQSATSPSDIRLDNLDARLNAFEVWRTFQPLALGIERQLFQHIAKHSLSAPKRVVQKLLRQHTRISGIYRQFEPVACGLIWKIMKSGLLP